MPSRVTVAAPDGRAAAGRAAAETEERAAAAAEGGAIAASEKRGTAAAGRGAAVAERVTEASAALAAGGLCDRGLPIPPQTTLKPSSSSAIAHSRSASSLIASASPCHRLFAAQFVSRSRAKLPRETFQIFARQMSVLLSLGALALHMEQTRAGKLTAKSEPPMAPFTVPTFQPQPALPHPAHAALVPYSDENRFLPFKLQWLKKATLQQLMDYKAKKAASDAARKAEVRVAPEPPDAAPRTSYAPRFACPAHALARTSPSTLSSFVMQPEYKAKQAVYDAARMAKVRFAPAPPDAAPRTPVSTPVSLVSPACLRSCAHLPLYPLILCDAARVQGLEG